MQLRSESSSYRTRPDQTLTGWPPGIPYIIGNEGCERFSFYGMKSILFVHLAALYSLTGMVTSRAEDIATAETHLFISGVYATPMIGAILADRLFGKYRTIIALSIVYCAGHAVLAAAEDSLTGMHVGLGLIALGSGGIKPCVSAHVGDQFGERNWFRVRTVFLIFYWMINFGSGFATLIIPWTRQAFGTSVAFGIPGILMAIATVVFWMGRHKFVHVAPAPGGRLGLLDTLSSLCLFLTFGHLFVSSGQSALLQVALSAGFLALGLLLFATRQRISPDDGFLAVTFWTIHDFFTRGRRPLTPADDPQSPDPLNLRRSRFWGRAAQRYGVPVTEGPVAVLKVVSVFFLVSVFWSLFDQHSSSWIRQASQMYLPELPWGGRLLPEQMSALNPFMVMALIPILNIIYSRRERRGRPVAPLTRMTLGMGLASLSFVAVAMIQQAIDASGPNRVHALWQAVPYIIITTAEVMVSITGLEFAYTQAPRRMKSTLMGFWLLTVALGNVLVAVLAGFSSLSLVEFFRVFAALMAVAALLFAIRARFYRPHDYPQ